MVGFLLKHPQLEVNLQDKFGQTALHLASMYGLTEIVSALLAHPKIDIEVLDKNRRLADDICCNFSQADASQKPIILKKFEVSRNSIYCNSF
jgi:ankyrin repeat protein